MGNWLKRQMSNWLKRLNEPIPAWEVWFIVVVFDLMQRIFNG